MRPDRPEDYWKLELLGLDLELVPLERSDQA
jgi:hypothetical protein